MAKVMASTRRAAAARATLMGRQDRMRIAQIALRRRVARLTRRFREARALARAFQWPHRPIVAQIIPTRRCNLSCAYCNEFDRSSAPVPITVLQERIDRLVDLGTGIITLSGGEPLLHPAVDEIVRHVRRRGVIATLITNGYLLTPAMIQRLNGAGLDSLQISIDNVAPDDVSKKSLDLLDRKLQMLAAHAMFDVTVNAVIGGGSAHPEDALIIGRRARALGFQSTVGIIHDAEGQLVPLTDREQRRSARRPASIDPCFRSIGTTASRRRSPLASRAHGTAAPAADTSTSARTASSTTARSSAGIQRSRWRPTRWTISRESTRPSSHAPRTARLGASTASP